MVLFPNTTNLHIASITSLSWVNLRIASPANALTLRFYLLRNMAVFLTTYLHITSTTSLSWVYLHIASHSKRIHASPFFCQEIWLCFPLQLTFTSPPSSGEMALFSTTTNREVMGNMVPHRRTSRKLRTMLTAGWTKQNRGINTTIRNRILTQ